MKNVATRFWKKVNKTETCWEWTGSRREDGYGFFKVDGRVVTAHRFSYCMEHGGEIPKGLVVMHLCDNPSCVRPEHLKLGTLSDNAVDMVNKRRHGGLKKRNEMKRRIKWLRI